MTTFLLALFLASPAAAQCDVYKDMYKDSDQQQPAPVVHASAPWTWEEAGSLFSRSSRLGKTAADLAGIWKRVGLVGYGSAGALNLGGYDTEASRGRLTISAPPAGNPFLTLMSAVVQGEGAANPIAEADAGWSFAGASWYCKLVDASNMLCRTGSTYLAYSREK